MRNWDWKIRSYKDGKFMVETVHMGEASRNMELRAIKQCGRTAEVIALSDHAKAVEKREKS